MQFVAKDNLRLYQESQILASSIPLFLKINNKYVVIIGSINHSPAR